MQKLRKLSKNLLGKERRRRDQGFKNNMLTGMNMMSFLFRTRVNIKINKLLTVETSLTRRKNTSNQNQKRKVDLATLRTDLGKIWSIGLSRRKLRGSRSKVSVKK